MTFITFFEVILIINIICVAITDMTDWPQTAKSVISFIATKGKLTTNKYDNHLIDCSLCQTFHLSNLWLIIYLIAGGAFSPLLIAVPILSALLTNITKSGIFLLNDFCMMIISVISKIIKLINNILK